MTPRRSWKRWLLPVLGLVIVAASTALVVGDSGVVFADVLEITVPLLLGIGVAGYGAFLADSDLPLPDVWRVTRGAYMGSVAGVAIGAWQYLILADNGLRPVDAAAQAVVVVAVSVAAGLVVGRYDVTRFQQLRDARLAESAINASMDGIAVLDEDGHYREMNQAHAEVYGYEDPAEMLGEHWKSCYTEDQLAPLTEEVFPRLEAEGRWRGELVAQRRDGSTFPQEISLTVLDDGGLVCVVRDTSDRERYTETLQVLGDATRRMMEVREARDDQIPGIMASAASRLLECEAVGVWRFDDDSLTAVASTDARQDVDEDRVLRSAAVDGTVITTSVEGGGHLTGDVSRELVAPIGEFGVFACGASDPDAYDEDDQNLARLLGANTAVALARLERDRELRSQTERMEFFNSILRHDVLNGMTVIQARASVLADELDGELETYAKTILDWSEETVDVITRVRHVLESLTTSGEAETHPVDVVPEVSDALDRVENTYDGVTTERSLPEAALVQANDLLPEVVGNVVKNAVEHNDASDLTVSVSIEDGPETTAVRIADDGAGLPEEDRDAVFRRGGTGHAKSTGSGFGLFFVDAMLEEYGGSVRVEDNEWGGATFVLEFPTAAAVPEPKTS